MKKYGLYLLSASLVLMIASCQEEENLIQGFSIDKKTITIGAEGGAEQLIITSDTEWEATANKPWISISPANGIGITECTIRIDSTLLNDRREAKLYFMPKQQEAHIVDVTQLGFKKQIIFKDSIIRIDAAASKIENRRLETSVTTNVPFRIEIVDENNEKAQWITSQVPHIDLDRGARPRQVKLRFDWKNNTYSQERTAHIHFIPTHEEDGEAATTLMITQGAAPVITDDRAGDSLAIITICDRLELMTAWDFSENMRNWDRVTLWEATDKDLPCPEAIGRVRSASFVLFRTEESIPQEVRYLKYAETIDFYGNTNTMLLNVELGSEICELEYLKRLRIGAYGIISLPEDFDRLGDTLEELDLSSNNLPGLPDVLTPQNFPHLKYLNLIANRRWALSDLRKRSDYDDMDGIGFYVNTAEDNTLKRLFLWESLEELRLSNNFFEGKLPEFTVGETFEGYTVKAWEEADVASHGDTLRNLIGMPKIMPNMKMLSINLNYFTGNAPDWLLYHPNLLEWAPEILIFYMKENGIDSEGNPAHFDNEPTSYDYYYDFFPGYREKYEFSEEFEEE